MPSYTNRYIKGKPDTDEGLTPNQRIDIKDIVKYASVILGNNGWVYCNNLDMVHGSLYGVSDGYLQICVHGQDIRFRNADPTAIVTGTPILGGVRLVNGVNQYGYVTRGDVLTVPTTVSRVNRAINEISRSRGIVVDGGKDNTINQDSPADVLVSLSYGD